MNKLLFSVINPIVGAILHSPLHGLMSRNTVLLEFTGRKTGKRYSTPVSYHATNGSLQCFTDRSHVWWRNLQDGREIVLTLRGRKHVGKPSVLADGSPTMQAALRDLLLVSPRDASHAGVRLDASGQPDASDLAKACQGLVLIEIELQD